MPEDWVAIAEGHRAELGAVVHAAAGRCAPEVGSALALHGHTAVGACLWAVGRGLPDEVVARLTHGPDGLDRRAEAVLSWHTGPDAELLVATGVAERQWLVVTGTVGELEVRPAPFEHQAGEVLLSDGAQTRRVPFPRSEPRRLVDEQDIASVLEAVRLSAAGGGAPRTPS